MRTGLFVLVAMAVGTTASAGTLRVPQDFATIQAAVDAAQPGDHVRVGPGRWCGATVDKRVRIEGHGLSTIVGCASPTLDAGPLRVGFLLTAGASGSQVRGFVFDGSGVSNQNTAVLAFAVFARGVDEVLVTQNVVIGSVQAFTNSGGGSAIVFQQRAAGAARAVGNSAEHNFIHGRAPDGLDEFGMAGVVIYGQDGATASHNLLALRENPAAQGDGVGILVSDRCCGDPTPFET